MNIFILAIPVCLAVIIGAGLIIEHKKGTAEEKGSEEPAVHAIPRGLTQNANASNVVEKK